MGTRTTEISTKMHYLARDPIYKTQKPFATGFPVDHIPGASRTNHRFEPANVRIKDAQMTRENFTLDGNGFAFLKGKTSLTPKTANDRSFIENVYFSELERLILDKYPMYERLEYLEHQVRKRHGAFPTQPGTKVADAQPAALPHSDYSKHGGFMVMEEFFPNQEKYYRDRDFDLLNVWRVLYGPNNDWPLALCDFKTIEPANEIIINDIINENSTGENCVLHCSMDSKHEWYYLPDQDVDDLLLFRNTDSKGRRPVAFHAAFDSRIPQEEPRHSIEVRLVAFRT